MKSFKGYLIVLLGEKVQVCDYISIKTTSGIGKGAKAIKVIYLVVNVPFFYNIIIDKPTFNVLEVVLGILYLTMMCTI